MKLYYAETLNPRKACAVAKYLNADIDFVHVDLARGKNRKSKFLALNPNSKVPVLETGGGALWEFERDDVPPRAHRGLRPVAWG